MNVYKVTVCFILVSWFITNSAVTLKENQKRGITSTISFPTFHFTVVISVWLCVLLYLYLFLKNCYAYYLQCKIRFVLAWPAKMGYAFCPCCLAPKLPYIDDIDSSRQFWLADDHVTNESTNHTLLTAVAHFQISVKEKSIRPTRPIRVLGLMNLALRKRFRRDIIGPRSPLTPLRVTGVPNMCNSVMGLALARRQRRDLIGYRSPLIPVLRTDSNLHYKKVLSIGNLSRTYFSSNLKKERKQL